MIPQHFEYMFTLPSHKYIQSQLTNSIISLFSEVTLLIPIFLSLLFNQKLGIGIIGAAIMLDIDLWIPLIGLFFYMVSEGCRRTGKGFS